MKLHIKHIIGLLLTTYLAMARNNSCSPHLCTFKLDLGSDTAVCVFPMVLRTTLPCGSHVWSTGGTADTLVIYKAGTYHVSVTDDTCTLTDTIKIYGRAAAASKRLNVWYFGTHAGLDFNKVPVHAISNTKFVSDEGSTAICDTKGDLLFYTQGTTVWNKNHEIMSNGEGLMGDTGATHTALIVPNPEYGHLYYLFTCPKYDPTNQGGLYCNTIDMSLSEGLGAVIIKNELLYRNTSEKMAAVRHANGKDVWLITHESTSNKFRTFLITKDSVSKNAVITYSDRSPHYGVNLKNNTGQLKVSSKGNRLLVTNGTQFELYSFSRATGGLDSMIQIPAFERQAFAYGCEFSPSGNKIYLTDRNSTYLRQYDISSGSFSSFKMFDLTKTGSLKGGMQLGPDGKIYIIENNKGATALGVINDPDASDEAAGYRPAAIALASATSAQQSLPTCMRDLLAPLTPNFSYTDTCVNAATVFKLLNFSDSSYVQWHLESDSISLIPSPAHVYTTKGLKTVALMYKDGCTAAGTDTIFKSFTMVGPIVNLQDTLACDLPLVLNASNEGAVYEWNTGADSAIIRVDTAGQYSVKVSLENCTAIDTVTIDTVVTVPASFFYSDTCFSSSTRFVLTGLIDTTGISWDFGDGHVSDSTHPVHSYAQEGIYKVTLKYSDSCGHNIEVLDSLNIIPSGPVALSAHVKDSVCRGEALLLSVDSIKGAGTAPVLEWRINGVKKSSSRVFAAFNLNNKDTVSAYVESDDACTYPKAAETNNIVVTVLEPPKPKLPMFTVFCRDEEASVMLDATTAGAVKYLWSTGFASPIYLATESGSYKVVVSDTAGCSASAETRVLVSCEPKISIPSAFTPNGDGKNDKLLFFPLHVRIFNIQIYNRWGELVFISDDPLSGWDGTYKGVSVPQGTYNYVCTYTGQYQGDADKQQMRGEVTVLE